MFSNLTVTKKGLILVLVPVIFLVVFYFVLSQYLADAEQKVRDLQTSKEVLLQLHKFDSRVARGIMIVTNIENSDEEILKEIRELKRVFRTGEGWRGIERLDPELKQVVEDSISMRGAFLKYLNKVETLFSDPTFDPGNRPRTVSTRELAGTIMGSHELSQQVLKIESRIQNAEPEELEKIRSGLIWFLTCGLVGEGLLCLGLYMLFTRDILERLRQISRNAHFVSAGRTLPPPQAGRDEIAQLDQIIHNTNEVLVETRRKEVAILDNAADVICSLDDRFRFTGISATVDKIWKYSQDELLASSIVSILAKDTRSATTQALERIALGWQQGELENVVRCKDGILKTFSWTIRWSAAQKTYFCVAHDITERRAVEKLKQQFLSIVSHDLRAPVTATGISISLLMSGKRGQLSDDIIKILGRTETSIFRLTDLVNELLELDKLEAGKLTLNRTTVSAYEICKSAKEALEAMATSAYVKVKGPKGDALIFGDEARLIQAVINLLSNAIKFSPKDGTVVLSIVAHDKFIDIRITDEGPGIAREDASLIFDKFRQSRTAKQTSVKSTGLGLAIVKAIVNGHDGEVGVDSEPGRGSTFWIRLPADTEDESP